MYSTNCTIHRNNRGKPPKSRGKKPRGSNTTLAKCGFFDPGPNCAEINPKKNTDGSFLTPKKSGKKSALLRGYAQSFFLAQKSNQNTWFSATLVFSLVFHWFSAVSPTPCTVVFKKTKLSCFGGFFSLVF